MNELRIGVIGLGRAGEKHARVYARMPGVTVRALCDTDAPRRDALCRAVGAVGVSDWRELLADPGIDAVSIVLPDGMHREAALAALKAGKHVLLEKPIASTLEDGRAIAEAARGYGKTFMVGHLLRFDARHTMARDAVAAGDVGRIVHVSCRRNSTITGAAMYRGHRTDTPLHLMIHDIDYVNWIMAAPASTVFARGRQLLLKDWGMHDTVLATIQYADGALAAIESCWILPESSPTGLEDRMEIVGEKGVIHLGGSDEGVRMATAAGASWPDSLHWPEVNGNPGGALLEELLHFVACATGAARPLVGAAEALQALVVADAISRSLREGREISLDGASA
jgi:predicted dehydrogenase